MSTGSERARWARRAAELDRFRSVPTDELIEWVLDGARCAWVFDDSEMPELSGVDAPDRELAAWVCAGCPVVDACLELDLRTAGPLALGVFGALPEQDRRALFAHWVDRRARLADEDPYTGPGRGAPW